MKSNWKPIHFLQPEKSNHQILWNTLNWPPNPPKTTVFREISALFIAKNLAQGLEEVPVTGKDTEIQNGKKNLKVAVAENGRQGLLPV